jgi:hypothetical protein
MVTKKNLLTAALAASAGCMALGVNAGAAPLVNGYINPPDYSLEVPLSLAVVAGGPNSSTTDPIAPTATMYLYQDASTGNLYVGLNVPLDVVDNTYGSNAIGWESAGGHTLNDLLGSDGAAFNINNSSGTSIFNGFMDYVSGGGYSGPGGNAGGTGPAGGPGGVGGPVGPGVPGGPGGAGGQGGPGGVGGPGGAGGPGGPGGPGGVGGPGGPGGAGGTGGTAGGSGNTFEALTSDGFNSNYGNLQDDASLTTPSDTSSAGYPGPSNIVLAAQTSMGYNYNLFKGSADAATLFGENGQTPDSPQATVSSSGAYIASDASYSGWDYNVQYTFEISGSWLKNQGFVFSDSAVSVPYIHASPSKYTQGIRFYTTPGGPTTIPAGPMPAPIPATLPLLAGGLLALGLIALRKRRHLGH